MRKFTKMFGLLLIAGALMMGCSHNNDDDKDKDATNDNNSGTTTTTTTTTTNTGIPDLSIQDLTDITQSLSGDMNFTDGNWQRIEVYSGSATSPETSAAGLKDTMNFTISGDNVSVTGGNIIEYQQMTITDSTELDRVKGNKETEAQLQRMGGKTATVSVNGNTITYAISGNYSDLEFDRHDTKYTTKSDLSGNIPPEARKLTNAYNTKYLIAWTGEFTEDMIKERDYENANFSVVYIKQ